MLSIVKNKMWKPYFFCLFKAKLVDVWLGPEILELDSGVKPLQVECELSIEAVRHRVKMLEVVDPHGCVDLELDRVDILVQFCVVDAGGDDVLVIA